MAKKNNMLNFKKLSSNKVVLYAVTFIALISIVNYIMNLNYNAIILFIAIAGLTYTYTKNMTIVLASSVIFTFILNFINQTLMREGMKNNESSSDEEQEEEEEEVSNVKKSKAIKSVGKKPVKSKSDKEKYQNYVKLNPSSIPNKESLKKQLGEIDNVEAAYDEYDTAISNNNLKTVSKNTKDIVSKQKDMLNQLKEMTPMLTDAMSSVESINTDGLQQMLEGVNKMADNFTK
tara:strand:- start:1225 stop:1923 length:699 start_codon:yes stop_codon:yes gene_type:complete